MLKSVKYYDRCWTSRCYKIGPDSAEGKLMTTLSHVKKRIELFKYDNNISVILQYYPDCLSADETAILK